MFNQQAFKTSSDGIIIKTNLGQWYFIVFFFRKMIFIETQYKTHNNKFLAIIKVFKIWYHYLKNYKHKIFVFIDYNNYYYFIDIKCLSFKQIC